MAAYLFRRLLQSALILLGVSFITFVLLYVLPADPVRQIAGRSATAQTVENIRRELGLDQPFVIQYGRYLWGMVQGDLGRSYLQKTEVAALIASRLPATLLLMLGAIACELVIGLTMGVFAALKRGTTLDHSLMMMSFVTVSAPQFVVGLLLLYVFAVQLGWFPIGGYGTFAHLVLPSLTLGILGSGWYSRMMRSSMLDVLRADFIRTARAKGLTRGQTMLRHALRNAMIPVMTILGMQFSFLLAGAIILENVFYLPGLGRLIFQAITQRDLIVVESVVMILVFAVIVVTFAVDLAYAAIDPRLRRRA